MIKSATLHKFTRILYLLNKLDKGRITLTQEAKELGFSARTLQRDLHEIERAGFPLAEIAAGRYGFAEGFSLNKMPLSARDKALLTLAGQLAESLGPNWHASFKRLSEHTVRPPQSNVYFIKMPRMWHSISPAILEKLEQAILKHQYIDIIRVIKPKAFVFENVPGLLTACPGDKPVRERIYEAFDKIGYEIPFTREFYRYTPLKPSSEIFQLLKELELKETEMMESLLH